MQACTEMVMPMASNKESIFTRYEWSFEDFSASCENEYKILPRPNWITSEFGGHVGYQFLIYINKYSVCIFSCLQ